MQIASPYFPRALAFWQKSLFGEIQGFIQPEVVSSYFAPLFSFGNR